MGANGDVEMTAVDGGGATTGVAEGEEDGAPAVDTTIDEDVDLAQRVYVTNARETMRRGRRCWGW